MTAQYRLGTAGLSQVRASLTTVGLPQVVAGLASGGER
jgi:hypothetical protein